MKNEVYAATVSGSYTNVTSTAASALIAPSTLESIQQAKLDIHSLVTTGKIGVKDNLHLYLGTPTAIKQIYTDGGLAHRTAIYDFTNLQIYAIKLS